VKRIGCARSNACDTENRTECALFLGIFNDSSASPACARGTGIDEWGRDALHRINDDVALSIQRVGEFIHMPF